jgi:hypothetical protein
MARYRYVYKGGKVIAEFHNDTLVHAEPEYYGEPVDTHLVVPDLPGYVSPVTGLWVEGRVARREDLKRSGSRPYEGREQELKEVARHKEYEAQRNEQRMEAAVRTAWAQMSPSTRRQLMQQ